MVQIQGSYKLESNENFIPYLKGLGSEVNDELAETIDKLRPILEVTVDGDHITLVTDAGSSASFTLGEEFEDEVLTGIKVKSIAFLEENVLRIESSSSDNRTGLRKYTFSDSGLVITYIGGSFDGIATRTYVRI